jgi:hypothetical protein
MNNKVLDGLAEKIAKAIAGESDSNLELILAKLENIDSRLDKLESLSASPNSAFSPQHLYHPSLDKLSVAEAIADAAFSAQSKEKACTFEPGKPCDHCSMCSSRGF